MPRRTLQALLQLPPPLRQLAVTVRGPDTVKVLSLPFGYPVVLTCCFQGASCSSDDDCSDDLACNDGSCSPP